MFGEKPSFKRHWTIQRTNFLYVLWAGQISDNLTTSNKHTDKTINIIIQAHFTTWVKLFTQEKRLLAHIWFLYLTNLMGEFVMNHGKVIPLTLDAMMLVSIV